MHIFSMSLSPRLYGSGIYMRFLVSVLQMRELKLRLLHNKHCGSFCNGVLAIQGFQETLFSPNPFLFSIWFCRKPGTITCELFLLW